MHHENLATQLGSPGGLVTVSTSFWEGAGTSSPHRRHLLMSYSCPILVMANCLPRKAGRIPLSALSKKSIINKFADFVSREFLYY